MSFELITLRFYHGGVMKIGKKGYKGKPYHGGGVYEFLDVDIDRSIAMLEIKSDYDTTLIAECLSHGDILDCFVCHFVSNPVLVPPLLEYGESGVGPDAGYDESIGGNRNNLEGKLAGDEPYYPSDEAASFETDPDAFSDDEEEVQQRERVKPRRRKKVNRVLFDASSQKVVWELGLVFECVNEFRSVVTKYVVAEHVAIEMYINEPTRVRVRCTVGCPWVLFASFDSRTNNFVVKTYNPVPKCDPTNRNKLCNSKFLSSHYSERIKEQPDIRIFEFQGLIKKELDLYVGRTVCRRARNKVLQELMSGYVLEFGRILDYKDELLRTNPDGNNQMLPLAWAVIEVENKFTWAWFVKLLKEDLQLGDGTDLTIISDIQKGLEIAITDHLPNVEHRMCTRHILANWSKR
ncbi:hypothetical protein KY290_008233 [Solanum tuberosum]|uniref:Transposase MuDR plant domain-containing protein n=1 Tax=Solanum tuberosum TaxID=4113 RepID=A0ABQ7WAI6_SOLTU|nr:hypothetical protein KY290_008233 [Solanum tuberosum]